MSDPSRAVFLSYASQDAEAAQRICEALRAAGIEVWFDQSELRGGDAWDESIRDQIKACALFIPIISANVHARTEGYFRLEWKLAIDRSHRMAPKQPFLLPVAIDETRQADDAIPDRFRELQWSRLPGGQTSLAFAERVQRLLSPPRSDVPTAGTPAGVPVPGRLPLARELVPAFWRSKPIVLTVAAAIAAAFAYLFVDRSWLSKHAAAEQPITAALPVARPNTPVATAIPEKSVAVLPFVNMSEDKKNEYFSDGLSEELIDMMTRIPDLRVPARTSSFYFKGKQATIPDIAKALGVAHVLEGSVRKSGSHLRITAQLVRADNGYHLWSETYDRRLDDIFKVQDEIATAVVAALKASLLEGGGASLTSASPTSSTEAYTLYLQARAIFANAPQLADCERAIEYLRHAVKLDPAFARAWATLAIYRTYAYWFFTGGRQEDVLAEAAHAANEALELDKTLPDAHLAMAQIVYYLEWNWPGAESEINRALTLDPRSAQSLFTAANIALTRGKFDQAVELAQKAVARDPLDAWNYGMVGSAFVASGKLSEARAAWRHALDLAPTMSQMHLLYGYVLATDREPAAALEQMDQETDQRYREVGRALALDALHRKSEADRALAKAEAEYPEVVQYPIALVYANRNDPARALEWLDRAYQLHDGWLPTWLPWDPLLNNLQSDPRYKAFRQKLNLPD